MKRVKNLSLVPLLIVWVSLLCLVGGVVYYFVAYIRESPMPVSPIDVSAQDTINIKETTLETTILPEKEVLIYMNEDLDFRIQLPEAWAEFRVVEHEDIVVFGAYDQDHIFSISRTPLALWNKWQQEESPMPMKITVQGEYVYGYGLSHDATESAGVLRGSVSSTIIPTFEIIQN